MSTSYHPETDGQTEVLNRTLEQYLRSFVHTKPSQWYSFLPLAEWAYNTSSHLATGVTPYEVIFGKPPPSIPTYISGSSPVEAMDSLLSNRQALLELLQRKLIKAQAQMKVYADKLRRDIQFQVGEFVYVRLRPYRQLSVTRASYNKLTKRFFGPYKILECTGPVAYKLELPSPSKIHHVFHCSLLKLHKGPVTAAPDILPAATIDNHPLITPLTILDTKLDHSTDPPTLLALVQWLGLAPEDTTWENYDQLQTQFHLEDKVCFPGGDIDSNKVNGLDPPKRLTRKPGYLKEYV